MKKLLAYFLVFLMITLCACGKESTADVVTYDTSTTESVATTEDTEPTEESTQEPTQPIVREHYEMVYSAAKTQRDAVGNIWLNVIAAFENISEETIYMEYSDIAVYAEGEETIVLEQVPCFPQVLAPGQVGYYFEQRQVDIDEDKPLLLEMMPNIHRSEPVELFAVEDMQIRDSAYGVEIQGMFDAKNAGGLVCVAVVLFNLDGDPFFVLFDYVSAAENGFVLSGDKLPEGLKNSDISSYIAYAYTYEE